jgi:hypothetical protein
VAAASCTCSNLGSMHSSSMATSRLPGPQPCLLQAQQAAAMQERRRTLTPTRQHRQQRRQQQRPQLPQQQLGLRSHRWPWQLQQP